MRCLRNGSGVVASMFAGIFAGGVGTAALALTIMAGAAHANELAKPDAQLSGRLARILNANADISPLGFRIGEDHAAAAKRIGALVENALSATRQELVFRKTEHKLRAPQRAVEYVFALNTPYQGTFTLSFCDVDPNIASPIAGMKLQAIRYAYRASSDLVNAAVSRVESRSAALKKDHRYYLRSRDGSTFVSFEAHKGVGPVDQVSMVTLEFKQASPEAGQQPGQQAGQEPGQQPAITAAESPATGAASNGKPAPPDGSISERYESSHAACTAVSSELPRALFEVTETRLR